MLELVLTKDRKKPLSAKFENGEEMASWFYRNTTAATTPVDGNIKKSPKKKKETKK